MADNSKVAGLMANLAMTPAAYEVSVVLPEGEVSGVASVHVDDTHRRIFVVTNAYVAARGALLDPVEAPEEGEDG